MHKDGYYWVRYVRNAATDKDYVPEIARFSTYGNCWYVTGEEIAFDPEEFTPLAGPLSYAAETVANG